MTDLWKFGSSVVGLWNDIQGRFVECIVIDCSRKGYGRRVSFVCC
jgi:hypothetical protein